MPLIIRRKNGMSKKIDGSKISAKLTEAAFAVALVLLLAFSAFAVMPLASAHTPPWNIPTYAYVSVTPDPIGVGQNVFVVMTIDKAFPSAAIFNDIRPHDYKLIITKPDGTTETKQWPVIGDTTSAQFTLYTPTQVGTYKFRFEYPGQVYTWAGAYQNDIYLPSSKETTLTVQEKQVAGPPTYPLPTSYWTRPIEGQNTAWASIASNWLVTPQLSNFQPAGIAPNSAHVMWTRQLEFGGVVGGVNVGIDGAMYYNGMSYEGRFAAPIIIQGRLYYSLSLGTNPSSGDYICVDLQTGEQVWKQSYLVNPTFGQLLWYDSQDQHGVIPYLWAVSGSTWMAYDANNGLWLFNLTNVPSGNNVYSPKGEILRYVLDSNGKWLALWNNTQAPDLRQTGVSAGRWRPIGKSVDASAAYSWNITLSQPLPAGSAINYANPEDILLGSVGIAPGTTRYFTPDPYTIFAISLKPNTRGQILWNHNYTAPPGNVTRQIGSGTQALVDPQNRVFILLDKEIRGYLGYSLDNGNLLWGPTPQRRSYEYYSATLSSYDAGAHEVAYGNLYVAGYGGLVFCYDISTGNLKWSYGNGGEGNSTNSGLEAPWGYYPTFISNIADGKLYLFTSEHSPNSPLYKGALVRCINATTGAEIWKMSSWLSSGSFYSQAGAIADGYLAYFNTYDAQIYCVGKGPSATTVTVSPKTSTKGTNVLIEGTVIDISAGAKNLVQTGEFNVVPAMSDASMGAWMEYLHMQKPKPSDAVGVQVKLTAIDPNDNTQEIGTVTSNIKGNYAIAWTPPISGLYTVTATFEGSNSYYGSDAETAFVVSEAPAASPTTIPTAAPTVAPTTAPTAATPSASPLVVPPPEAAPSTDIYIIAAAAAVIIVVAAVAAVFLRKRK